MNQRLPLKVLGFALGVWLAVIGDISAREAMRKKSGSKAGFPETATLKIQEFRLGDVRLLDSPFKQAMVADAEYVLKLDPDRLLSRFREYSGLTPKATVYGGWEQESLSGHTLGHYLSACALLYAATRESFFQQRIAYVVQELAACQDALGDGYVAAIPNGRQLFAEVARGDIHARPFTLNGGWSPFYNLHKTFAGLRDAWRHARNSQALDVERKLANWVAVLLSGLSESQMRKVLACEFGGMNEVLADLSTDTGHPGYLELAKRFHHQAVIDPLTQGKDGLNGLHANTQIPKLIGAARLYQLAGMGEELTAARFFWNRVVYHHSYVTGGNSESEYFGPTDRLDRRLTDRTAETCNTYNMLKLTRLLFQIDPRVEYMDYYERALYNHILASQDPTSGMVTHFVPLRSGQAKVYSTPFDTFTCCLGTGMESQAKYADSIYFRSADALYVNLFIPSEVNWLEKGVMVRQDTKFPDDGVVKLKITCGAASAFALRIRCPAWTQTGMSGTVNGQPFDGQATPGHYWEVRRIWRDGDLLEIRLPIALRMEAMPDNPQRVAFFWGPVLLAGELGPEEDLAAKRADYAPVLLGSPKTALQQLKPVSNRPGSFRIGGIGRLREVTLEPFFRVHHRRYAVYWEVLTVPQWNHRQTELGIEQKRQREIEDLVVDWMHPGQAASETSHQFRGEKLESDRFNERPYHLSRGGWIAYEMAVLPDQPMALRCVYWGGERPGSRVFEVRVEDEIVATQSLANDQPGEFFDRLYVLPEHLTKGKDRIKVTFHAGSEKMAGGIFDLQTLLRKPAATVSKSKKR